MCGDTNIIVPMPLHEVTKMPPGNERLDFWLVSNKTMAVPSPKTKD